MSKKITTKTTEAKKKVKAAPKMSEREFHKRMLKVWNRSQSEFCEVRDSKIHGRGVYATQAIKSEEKVIEYVGELIDKDESGRRGTKQHEHAIETGDAAVYIFNISKKYDMDGNFPWNSARLINHSCEPNCEAWATGKKIFIHALTDIAEGDELTFDYGFDVDCYEDHPCRCGRESCVGYIVSRTQWDELDEKLGRGKSSKKSS